MNGYVQEERAKGVRVRLNNRSHLITFTSSLWYNYLRSTSRFAMQQTPSRHIEPVIQERGNQTHGITPTKHEFTMDQFFQQASVPPPTPYSFEEGLKTLPLARSVASTSPISMSCSIPLSFVKTCFPFIGSINPNPKL